MLKPASVLVYVCQPSAAACSGVALAGSVASPVGPAGLAAAVPTDVGAGPGGAGGRELCGTGMHAAARSNTTSRTSHARVCIVDLHSDHEACRGQPAACRLATPAPTPDSGQSLPVQGTTPTSHGVIALIQASGSSSGCSDSVRMCRSTRCSTARHRTLRRSAGRRSQPLGHRASCRSPYTCLP